MHGKQFGRNMLIGEYLWLAYLQTLPPADLPMRKGHLMARTRKQVSSHIQVLKNFFAHHKCCESHPLRRVHPSSNMSHHREREH